MLVVNDVTDREARAALEAWGLYLRYLQPAGPPNKNASDIMVDPDELLTSDPRTPLSPEVESLGIKIEAIMIMVPARSKHLLKLYFYRQHSIASLCSHIRVNRRETERQLNFAIGQIAILMGANLIAR